MKRAICFLTSIMLCFGVLSALFVSKTERIVKAESNPIEKHLILNADGSYGGSLNEELYGKGAPKNGEFDVFDSPYFTVNDFYNMKSTNEEYPLTLFPNFKGYQQTMANSSAFACLVMVCNYMGEDISGELSELSLMQKYEEFKSVSIKDADVNEKDLTNFIDSLSIGIKTEQGYNYDLKKDSDKYLSAELQEVLSSGKFVLTRYQSQADYGWKLIIGIDQMGTKDHLDDIIIFANPFDVSDHYQDGYSTESLGRYLVWLQEVKSNGEKVDHMDETIILDAGDFPDFERTTRDTSYKQPHPELHFILNADGSYGGTRDKDKYGTITTKDGNRNVLYSNYYKVNDYYNMKDEGSRLFLKNYNIFQQTMSASCGICSIMGVLNYYGKDVDESWEVTLCDDYYEIAKKPVNPSGTKANYNAEVLKKNGLKAKSLGSKAGEEALFPTYESYRDFMKENLKKDRPVMVCITPRGHHWETVIGFDDMGTANIYDDVFITADSSDYWDHYQDGYNTFSATNLYRIHHSLKSNMDYNLVYLEQSPTSPLLIVGIIAGAVVVVGGVVVTLILLKKKKTSK